MLATLALAAGSAGFGAPPPSVHGVLLSGVEALVPLAAAMAAVTVVSVDRCRELQLALPARYPGTLARRLGIVAGSGAALAVLLTAVLRLTGSWTGPRSALASVLVWASPLLGLTGLALLVAVLGRSVVLATTTVAVVWLCEQLFAPVLAATAWSRPFFLFLTSRAGVADGWGTNRAVLAACGVLFIATALLLLRRPERLLTEEEA
ncbi:hypothetical protein GCM10010116_25980 [Microbispora rosea subsp. aerata]|nr:hypothetical protein GCM10010116_25980 [Microbispora rosea subsp. aerata]GIH54160.1 hypothetical protein Mro02_10740 [Microbispora rosea subsp. aerata]GLJ85134.1 hypothetical protein GCM10017588_38620 [Microbispora rosea subsp. aerata]